VQYGGNGQEFGVRKGLVSSESKNSNSQERITWLKRYGSDELRCQVNRVADSRVSGTLIPLIPYFPLLFSDSNTTWLTLPPARDKSVLPSSRRDETIAALCSPPTREEEIKASASGFDEEKGKYGISRIKVPDTRLVRDAIDLARSSSEPYFSTM